MTFLKFFKRALFFATAVFLFFNLFFALALVAQAESIATKNPNNFDLKKYAGDWYEIARTENSFQKGCFATKANYTVSSDGHLLAVNTCNLNSFEGKVKTTKTTLKVKDANSPHKLETRVFWFFKLAYWVVHVSDDYNTAIVVEPDYNYTWILARSPQLDDAEYNKLLELTKAKGYSIKDLQKTPHMLGGKL